MKSIDSWGHLRGESIYLDDIPELEGTLHGAVYASPIAHGVLRAIESAGARAVPGVVAVFTALDIPGANQIGGIVPDEPLLANGHVHFCGQPVALVLATSDAAARAGAAAVKASIDPLPPVLDPREAARKGQLLVPAKSFRLGGPRPAAKNTSTSRRRAPTPHAPRPAALAFIRRRKGRRPCSAPQHAS